jgi:hypothetical protein
MSNRILLAIAALFGLFGIFLYIVFFSSLPLLIAAAALHKAGVQTSGLHGSFSRGFDADLVTYHNGSPDAPEEATFEWRLEKIRFNHSGFFSLLFERKVIIDDFHLDKVFVRLPEDMKGPSFRTNTQADPVAPPHPLSTQMKGSVFGEFKIEKVDVENVSVQIGKGAPFTMDAFKVRNFDFAKGKLTLESVDMDSNFAKLHAADIRGENGRYATTTPIEVLLKAEKMTFLKKDLPVKITFEYQTDRSQARLSSFDDHLVITYDQTLATNPTELKTTDFNPTDYFNKIAPIKAVQIVGHPSSILEFAAGQTLFQGSFQLGQAVFHPPASHPEGSSFFVYETAAGQVEFRVKPYGSPAPYFALASNLYGNVAESLAIVYYALPFTRLGSAERQLVIYDSVFFSPGTFLKY